MTLTDETREQCTFERLSAKNKIFFNRATEAARLYCEGVTFAAGMHPHGREFVLGDNLYTATETSMIRNNKEESTLFEFLEVFMSVKLRVPGYTGNL